MKTGHPTEHGCLQSRVWMSTVIIFSKGRSFVNEITAKSSVGSLSTADFSQTRYLLYLNYESGN